ncbi:hypothetical protein HDV00_006955 [Rhizophlyctis rosea]|nr:hypothetical protein HDV00_006955 [Rhizophlyctis rosea]
MASTTELNANRSSIAKAGTILHCLFYLFILQVLLLPINLAACLITHLLQRLIGTSKPTPTKSTTTNGKPITVLIDGGRLSKGLFLARICKAAGHRVIYTSTPSTSFCGARFSSAVDVHCAIPRSHENYAKCAASIRDIIKKENVDLYIPVSTATSAQTDAKLAEEVIAPLGVKSISLSQKDTARLDDKSAFGKWCEEIGASTPITIPVTSTEEALSHFKRLATTPPSPTATTYLLKSIQYDDAHRSDIFLASESLTNPTTFTSRLASLPISPSRPWILQQFIRGKEYCSHVLVLEGKVLALSICPSSHWLLQYTPVKHEGITKWIEDFVAETGLSGHVCFDFMVEDTTNKVYCIECNPRVSTAVGCFRSPSIMRQYGRHVESFLDSSSQNPSTQILTPPPQTPTQHWLYHELILLSQTRTVKAFAAQLYAIVNGQDALFDVEDPWPFFAQNHLLIPGQLVVHIRAVRPWSGIDFNLGRLVD